MTNEILLLHGLILLFAGVSALTLAGGFLRLRMAGLVVGTTFAVGGELLLAGVWALNLTHDQKIFLFLPFLVVQVFALVNSYRFLYTLAGKDRDRVIRRFVLGLPTRRTVISLLVGHLREVVASVWGGTLLMGVLRLLLAAGIAALSTRVLPILWAVLLLPLVGLGWFFSFAFVVAIVIKFWEEKRSLPRIIPVRKAP